MQLRLLLCLAGLAVTGCSFTAQNDTLQGQFNPPLVYPSWHSNQYVSQNGIKVCTVTAGNALTVTTGTMQNGLDVVVASNHPMQPGNTLTVNVNGKTYETSDTYFSAEQGRKLVGSLMQGDKAYLEWSETNGPSGGQRINVQNIVRLDNFRELFKQCHDSLTPMAAQ